MWAKKSEMNRNAYKYLCKEAISQASVTYHMKSFPCLSVGVCLLRPRIGINIFQENCCSPWRRHKHTKIHSVCPVGNMPSCKNKYMYTPLLVWSGKGAAPAVSFLFPKTGTACFGEWAGGNDFKASRPETSQPSFQPCWLPLAAPSTQLGSEDGKQTWGSLIPCPVGFKWRVCGSPNGWHMWQFKTL